MNKLIYDIFNHAREDFPSVTIAEDKITEEVKKLVEPYKEQLTLEEYETLTNLLYSATYHAERELFAVGFYYAVELLLNKEL